MEKEQFSINWDEIREALFKEDSRYFIEHSEFGVVDRGKMLEWFKEQINLQIK